MGARSGSAMVLGVMVVTAMLAVGMSFVMLSLRANETSDASIDDTRAFYLAEAAITEALTSLRAGESGVVGSQDAPAITGGGLLWTEVTDLGNDELRIVATSMHGSGRAAIEVTVRNGMGAADRMFPAMLFSDKTLGIDSNQLVDSYDSSLGTYASQAVNAKDGLVYANDDGDIGSNENIVVGAKSAIFGDSSAGPSGSTSVDATGFVTGSTKPSSDLVPMTGFTVPSYTNLGSLTVSSTKTLSAGNYQFGSLKIQSGETLFIEGPAEIVVSGKFETQSKANLIVDSSNGGVTFYNNGQVRIGEDTTISSTNNSGIDLVFMIASSNTVSFPDGLSFAGGIYSPKATIELGKNSDFYGAIVADEIVMAAGTNFHFDEVLLNRQRPGATAGTSVEVLAWTITRPEDDELLANRSDPFTVLGVKRTSLSSPSESWALEETKQ